MVQEPSVGAVVYSSSPQDSTAIENKEASTIVKYEKVSLSPGVVATGEGSTGGDAASRLAGSEGVKKRKGRAPPPSAPTSVGEAATIPAKTGHRRRGKQARQSRDNDVVILGVEGEASAAAGRGDSPSGAIIAV